MNQLLMTTSCLRCVTHISNLSTTFEIFSAVSGLRSMPKLIVSKLNEYKFIQFQSGSMSDPPFSDIDFKNNMTWVWTTLKNFENHISSIKFKNSPWLSFLWSYLEHKNIGFKMNFWNFLELSLFMWLPYLQRIFK